MKLFINPTFTDSLKDEFWDSTKRGWAYPWLKTRWVKIKSMESGGATIPHDRYRVDYEKGVVFWLAEGTPKNMTVTVESKKSFLGIHRKRIQLGVLLGMLGVLGAIYWFSQGPKSPDNSSSTLVVDSLEQIIVQRDTALLAAQTKVDSQGILIENLATEDETLWIDSVAQLRREIVSVKRDGERQGQRYAGTLRAKNREIANLREQLANCDDPPPLDPCSFSNVTARIFDINEQQSQRLESACRNMGITSSYAGVVSPQGKAGTICYGGNANDAAECVRDAMVELGFIMEVTRCAGTTPDKQINIYIQ